MASALEALLSGDWSGFQRAASGDIFRTGETDSYTPESVAADMQRFYGSRFLSPDVDPATQARAQQQAMDEMAGENINLGQQGASQAAIQQHAANQRHSTISALSSRLQAIRNLQRMNEAGEVFKRLSSARQGYQEREEAGRDQNIAALTNLMRSIGSIVAGRKKTPDYGDINEPGSPNLPRVNLHEQGSDVPGWSEPAPNAPVFT